MRFLRPLDVLAAFFQGLVIREIPELMKPGHRFAPVGHGALRFFGCGVGKGLLGFLVLERMEQRDALFDGGLDLGAATGGGNSLYRVGRVARRTQCPREELKLEER